MSRTSSADRISGRSHSAGSTLSLPSVIAFTFPPSSGHSGCPGPTIVRMDQYGRWLYTLQIRGTYEALRGTPEPVTDRSRLACGRFARIVRRAVAATAATY